MVSLFYAVHYKGGFMNFGGLGRGLGRGGGRGRMAGPEAAGPVGVCVCTNPKCGYQTSHQRGQPCYQMKCPKCGSPMIR